MKPRAAVMRAFCVIVEAAASGNIPYGRAGGRTRRGPAGAGFSAGSRFWGVAQYLYQLNSAVGGGRFEFGADIGQFLFIAGGDDADQAGAVPPSAFGLV